MYMYIQEKVIEGIRYMYMYIQEKGIEGRRDRGNGAHSYIILYIQEGRRYSGEAATKG